MSNPKLLVCQPGHADSYANLKITFIHGRNPDLFIKNDKGDVIEKIDLSGVSGNTSNNYLTVMLIYLLLNSCR